VSFATLSNYKIDGHKIQQERGERKERKKKIIKTHRKSNDNITSTVRKISIK